MIRHGLHPITLDKRDFSAHRTFGTVSAPHLPDDFTVDIGKTMPDQNADGFPDGCTGYTQTDNLNDEDDAIFKPGYTYGKTCLMEGHDMNQGCQIRTSMKSTRVYGVQRLDETTDQEAEQHRGGSYFNIYNDGGLDWFDSIRSQITLHKKGASLASPWFRSWEFVGPDGILPMPTVSELQQAAKNPASQAWHNYAAKGWKTVSDPSPRALLRIKSWQGPNYGDKGWCYMSREVANVVFEIRGSGAFIQAHADPNDIQGIKLSILETAIDFLYRIIGLKRLN